MGLFTTSFPVVFYLLLSPFYLFPSGLPQIADVVLAAGIVFVLLTHLRLTIPKTSFVTVGFVFVAWIMLINFYTGLYLQTLKPLSPVLFYSYNFIVVLYLLSLHSVHRKKILSLLFWSTTVSIIMQSFLVFLLTDISQLRQIGFFNNPNQLGYFALCSMGIALLTRRYVQVSRKYLLLFLAAGAFLVLSSLSKAAMVSSVLIFAGFAFSKKPKLSWEKRFNLKNILLSLLLIGIVGLAAFMSIDRLQIVCSHIYEKAIWRIDQIGYDQDDNLEGRGYGRIWIYPESLMYGSGEGVLPGEDPRYDDPYMGGEIHSIFGTLLFSYGFIGFGLFMLLLYFAVKGAGLITMLPLAAVSLYGLTHQGLRFTHLWILIAVAFLSKLDAKKTDLKN